jgi:hypothetical protein
MMPTVTDYHALIRDAEVKILQGLDIGVPVVAVDDLEGPLPGVSLPCVVVACVGPETERPEYGTNRQDGRAYPCAVALLAAGVANGDTRPVPTLTAFRRLVTTTFNNQRLTDVSQVAVCEVSPDGPVVDKEAPYFQRLSTALVVTAVGRFPRS